MTILRVNQYEMKIDAGRVREVLQLGSNETVIGASYQSGHLGSPDKVVFLIEQHIEELDEGSHR